MRLSAPTETRRLLALTPGRLVSGRGRFPDLARILAQMATTSEHPRPRPSSSPFLPHREPTVETYELDDRVSHDSYGLGRVVGVDAGGATVDFTSRTVRIPTPFRKMTKL